MIRFAPPSAALAALVLVIPALASAEEPPPSAAARADGIVWQEPVPPPRRSPAAFVGGIVMASAGAATTAVGVGVFAAGRRVDCVVALGGAHDFQPGPDCGDNTTAMHTAGGILLGVGVTAVLVGVPLAIWGGSHQGAPQVDVALGPASARARFSF